ncbi:hypothetical protein JCM15765_29360 [Paradesulfitobacterium aromaticivorans]
MDRKFLKYCRLYFCLPGVVSLILLQGVSNIWLRTAGVTVLALGFLALIEGLIHDRRRLLKAASIDDLTGLGNFRLFKERITLETELAKRRNTPLTLLLIDLDSFKTYNDSFGHQRGNELLRASGQILKEAVRATDGVYRFGGDEFAVVFPDTSVEAASRVANRIARVFARLNGRGSVTLSMGMASYRGESMEEFFERVDSLLYNVKVQGGDSCQLEPEESIALA